jgi:N utilization substance protein A
MKAEVIVADDQLSLAIGKHGQNVRLASRLIGWELDIRTKDTAGKPKEEKIGAAEVVAVEAASAEGEVAEEVEVKPEKKKKKAAKEKAVKEKAAKTKSGLEDLSGVGEKTITLLEEAGFSSLESIAKAKIEGLTQVKGIGEKKAQKLIEEAKKLAGK